MGNICLTCAFYNKEADYCSHLAEERPRYHIKCPDDMYYWHKFKELE